MRDYFEYLRIPYKHLESDCYALVRTFYEREFCVSLPKVDYSLDWAKEGKNLIATMYEGAGFLKTVTPDFSYGNIIVFEEDGVHKHLGVSLGDTTFLHTTIRGTARHSYVLPLWASYIGYTLRYGALNESTIR